MGEDLELVARARADAGDEDLPDPAAAERAHRVRRALPVVEVADHPHGPCVRGPDRERRCRRRRPSVRRSDGRSRRAPSTAPRGAPRPSRCRSISPSDGRNRYGSSTGRGDPRRRSRRAGSRGSRAPSRPPPRRLVLVRRPATRRRGVTTTTASASGRSARSVTTPSSMCAPRIRCGSWCTPAAMAASSSANTPYGVGPDGGVGVVMTPPCHGTGSRASTRHPRRPGVQQAVDRAERHIDPVRPVARLVDHLVQRLVELEGGQQRQHARVGRGRRRRA